MITWDDVKIGDIITVRNALDRKFSIQIVKIGMPEAPRNIEENVMRWIYGNRIRANGKPSTRKHFVKYTEAYRDLEWVGTHEIVAVKKTPWSAQVEVAGKLSEDECKRHADVSYANKHRCTDCFCCACAAVCEQQGETA